MGLARCEVMPLVFYALINRHLKALSTPLQKYYNKDNLIMCKLWHLLEPDGNICN